MVEEHRAHYVKSMLNGTQNHPWQLKGGINTLALSLLEFEPEQYVKVMSSVLLQENIIRGILASNSRYSEKELRNFRWYSDDIDESYFIGY